MAAVLLPGRHAEPGRPQRQDHLVLGAAGAHEALEFKEPREKGCRFTYDVHKTMG